MAISRLNAVFARHHRIFFGFLMVLIIFSFLIFTGPGESPFSCATQANCGTVYGRNVSVAEINGQLRFNNFVYGGSTGNDFQSFMMAYEVISLAEAARERGFNVSDSQLSRQIAAMPFFMENGKFSPEAYKKALASMGLSTYTFETALKNFILMQKVNTASSAGIVITDDELNRFYDYMYEKFTVSAKTFKSADYLNGLTAGDADVEAWFNDRAAEGNPYMLPNRYSAAAVIVDINDPVYTKKVNIDPARMEENIQARYEAAKSRFTAPDGTVKPVSEVKAELFKEIMAAEAAKYACAALEEFITDTEPLLYDAETRLAELTKAAKQNGFTVVITDSFAEHDVPAVLAEVPYLASAVTKRTMSSPITASAVNGTKAGIAVLLAYQPTEPATLADVSEEAKADYLADKARKEALKAVDAERIRLESLAPEARIAACTRDSGYESNDQPRGVLIRFPQGMAMADAEAGTVIEPIETFDGYTLCVITNRTLPDKSEFEAAKNQNEYELFNFKYSNMLKAAGEDMSMKGCIAPQNWE